MSDDRWITRVEASDFTEEELAEIREVFGEEFDADSEAEALDAEAPLGRKEYCATCLSGPDKYKRHTIIARNWLFAQVKAGVKCGGPYQMERGRCR